MKKALVVFLILAVAGGLFADKGWSGSVQTGALFTFEGDNPVKGWGDSDPVKASLSFTNSGDDWEIKAGVNASVGTDGTASLSIGDMFGRVKFGGIFQLSAGKGIGDAWTTGDNTGGKIAAKNNISYRLNITPMGYGGPLDFGVRFGFPKGTGTSAGKLADFFQETGIGVKYNGGAWNAAAGLDLFSEENAAPVGLEGNAYFGFNYNALDLVKIHFGGKVTNVFEKTDPQKIQLFERLSGSIAGIDWTLDANEVVVPSPVTLGLDPSVSYGIGINDKAKAEVGADAGLTVLPDFSFDSVGAYAKLTYDFNSNVQTWFNLAVDVALGDETVTTPTLKWFIKYSF
jgi:hypothetical protein